MDSLTELKLRVRAAAGHDAYRIVQRHGVGDGADIIAEALLTYLAAHAAVVGWDESLRIVHDRARQSRAVSTLPVGKLELAVSNSAEVLSKTSVGSTT